MAGLGDAEPAWTLSAGGGDGVLHVAVSRYDVAGAPTGLRLHRSVDGGAG